MPPSPLSRRLFLTVPAALMAQRRLDPSIVGANTAIAGYGLGQAVDALRVLNFPTIEIHPMGVPEPRPGLFPGFQFDRMTASQRSDLRRRLGGFKNITTHLPYIDLHYFSEFSNVRDFSIRQVEIAMEATAFFGGRLGVVHVTAPPSNKNVDQIWPAVVDLFRRWGDRARRLGFRLGIETGLPRSVRGFVKLIREIDHDSVGCTLDVGHQIQYEEFLARVAPAQRSTPAGYRAYNDVLHELIDQLGSRIFHFHVHDIDPADWKEHKPLGFGVIDYPRLLTRLKQLGYPGLLVLEIGAPDMPRALADSRNRMLDFLAEA